jgi:hypothetical protein
MLPSAPAVSASETLPSSAFESLLPKLLTILQVTQRPEGTGNVRNKQDLLQAVSGTTSSPSIAYKLERVRHCVYIYADPGVPRSSEPGALARSRASGRRATRRGARRGHCHARETARKEAVRFVVSSDNTSKL